MEAHCKHATLGRDTGDSNTHSLHYLAALTSQCATGMCWHLFTHNTVSFLRIMGEPTAIWDTVREELRCLKALMIFVFGDWWWQLALKVMCVDSSLSAWCVCQADWDPADVAKAGRVSERIRWKLGAEVQAHGFALIERGKLIKVCQGGYAQAPKDLIDKIEAERWDKDQHPPKHQTILCSPRFSETQLPTSGFQQ